MPVTEVKVPLVFQFHGYPGASRSFLELSGFVASNMAVVAMDCRGQGGKSHDQSQYKGPTVSGHIIMGLESDSPDDLYYRKVFLDTVVLVNLMKTFPYIDEHRLYSNVASQGAALALVCAALNPEIKRTGTGLIDDVCPPSAQFAVYNNLTCEKEHHLYPNYTHELIRDFDDRIVQFLRK